MVDFYNLIQQGHGISHGISHRPQHLGFGLLRQGNALVDDAEHLLKMFKHLIHGRFHLIGENCFHFIDIVLVPKGFDLLHRTMKPPVRVGHGLNRCCQVWIVRLKGGEPLSEIAGGMAVATGKRLIVVYQGLDLLHH